MKTKKLCSLYKQDQMIAVCGEIVRSSILREIHSAPLFSTMADEETDVSNKEQLALYIRYVNSSTLNIMECFLVLVSVLQVLQERQLLHRFYRILKIGSFLLLSYVVKLMMVLGQW